MKKPPVKIIKKKTLIPNWAAAQVLMPRKIFVKPEHARNARLIAHELRHVIQWEEHGILFGIKYLLSMIPDGYSESKYEQEARAAEKDSFYLDWARELISKY